MPKSSENATAGSKVVANKFVFTEKRLAKLPLPSSAQRAYFYDATVRGLAVAVSPLGKKTFILYRKVDGRPERIAIGPVQDLTIEQARNRAEELNSEIARGENPALNKRRIRDEATLKELFDTFLEHHSKVFKRTWKNDQSMFKAHLSQWQFRKLSSISKVDVINLHRRIGARGKISANRTIEFLSQMFNRAREWGWTGENPCIGVTRFRERKRERFMDGRELKLFFQSLQQEENTTARDFFLVALLTGARRANTQAMQWRQINWTTGTWAIPAESSKSGEAMSVILSPTVLQILERRKATSKSEFVFPGKGKKSKHFVEPKSAWRRILARAKKIELAEWMEANKGKTAEDFKKQQEADSFADLRLHDLRRTLGSWQAATGASLLVIGKSLGHKSVAATQVYARLNLDPVRAAVNTATAAMLSAADVKLLEAGSDEK